MCCYRDIRDEKTLLKKHPPGKKFYRIKQVDPRGTGAVIQRYKYNKGYNQAFIRREVPVDKMYDYPFDSYITGTFGIHVFKEKEVNNGLGLCTMYVRCNTADLIAAGGNQEVYRRVYVPTWSWWWCSFQRALMNLGPFCSWDAMRKFMFIAVGIPLMMLMLVFFVLMYFQ